MRRCNALKIRESIQRKLIQAYFSCQGKSPGPGAATPPRQLQNLPILRFKIGGQAFLELEPNFNAVKAKIGDSAEGAVGAGAARKGGAVGTSAAKSDDEED